MSKQRVNLSGVPETLLWPLHNRAAYASRPDAQLRDPKAVEIYQSIDYPFRENFGRPSESHALRAMRFDDGVRRFLGRHPEGTVVALADGLETGFWRTDNGRMKWLAVDLPETMEVRRRWLPDSERHRNLACSALDFRWMDEVDPSRGVHIMAEGLLMYFEARDVHRLLAACAERFPGGTMMFDVIPHWLSQRSLRGLKLSRTYRVPPMPFGLDVNEQQSLRAVHPNIVSVHEVDIGRGVGWLFGYVLPTLERLPMPRSLRDRRPALLVLTFGGTA